MRKCKLALALSLVLPVSSAFADGVVFDKIYHPYVDALEHELEYRAIIQDEGYQSGNSFQLHKVSLGTSLGESWFGELYLVEEKNGTDSLELEAVELELKWQLTEQGEYSADWGLLFEYETAQNIDAQEVSVGLLTEKEWGRWSGTSNLFVINEWGDDIKDEVETALSLQLRYRYSRALEPALEFYKGQGITGLGPVIQGQMNTGIRKSIRWESGLIFGIHSDTPDLTFRFLFEYEF